MGNGSVKKVITAGILIVLFIIAVKILLGVMRFAFAILLPAAVIGLIVYLIYKVVSGKKN